MIVECPSCRMQVIPHLDGGCPSCRAKIAEPDEVEQEVRPRPAETPTAIPKEIPAETSTGSSVDPSAEAKSEHVKPADVSRQAEQLQAAHQTIIDEVVLRFDRQSTYGVPDIHYFLYQLTGWEFASNQAEASPPSEAVISDAEGSARNDKAKDGQTPIDDVAVDDVAEDQTLETDAGESDAAFADTVAADAAEITFLDAAAGEDVATNEESEEVETVYEAARAIMDVPAARRELVSRLVERDFYHRSRHIKDGKSGVVAFRLDDYLERFPLLTEAGGPAVELIVAEFESRRCGDDKKLYEETLAAHSYRTSEIEAKIIERLKVQIPDREVACNGFGGAFGACVLVFIAEIMAGIFVAPWFMRRGAPAPIGLSFILSQLTVLFVAIMILRSAHEREVARVVAWRLPRGVHLLLVVILVIPLQLLVAALTDNVWSGSCHLEPIAVDWSKFHERHAQLAAGPWWMMVACGCLAPAVCEEIFFRGLLGRGLVAKYGVVAGVIVTSLIFALFHIEPSQIFATFWLGCMLHFVHLTTKSLIAASVVHFLNNLIAFSMMRYEHFHWIDVSMGDDSVYLTKAVIVTSLVLTLIIVVQLWRTRARWVFWNRERWKPGFITAESPPRRAALELESDRVGRLGTVVTSGAWISSLVALFFLGASWSVLSQSNRALYLVDRGQPEKALVHVDRAISSRPRMSWPHACRAWVLLNLGRLDEALQACNRAIEFDPDSGPAYVTRAFVYNERDEFGRALKDANAALHLGHRSSSVYSARCAAHLGVGNHLEAVEDATRALDIDSDHLQALGNRGCALVNLERYEEALDDLNRAIELDSSDTFSLCWRAKAHLSRKEFRMTIRDASKALRLERDSIFAHHLRALAYREVGDLDDAVDDLTHCLNLDGRRSDLQVLRGEIHLDRKDGAAALADFNDLAKRFPEDHSVFGLRSSAYQLAGDEVNAKKDLLKANTMQLRQLVADGWEHLRAGHLRDAIQHTDKAIQQFPDEAQLYMIRAASYWEQRNLTAAIGDYLAAKQRDPKNTVILINLGDLHIETGAYQQAVSHLSDALKLDRNNESALRLRARAYRELGETARAEADLKSLQQR